MAHAQPPRDDTRVHNLQLAATAAGAPAEMSRPSLQSPAPAPTAPIKPVAPRPAPTRRNCGTVWTGWIDNPDADVNPCQKGCERGEQRQVKTYKSGDTTRYDVNYQCYLLVPAPRPAIASATPRKNCGIVWTGWIDDPDADINPCSKGCEPGEQQIVDAHITRGVKQYNVRYQCYVAEAAPKRATGRSPASQSGTAAPQEITSDRIVMQGRWPLQSASSVTLATGPIQMTGRWPAALDRTVVASDAIRMTGRWPATAVSSQTVNAPPIQMTGRWRAALAATVITSSAIRMTGRWPAAFTPVTITTDVIRMTGRSPP